MIKRILLNDEYWLVTLGVLGGITVTSNKTGRSRKSSKEEAAYLKAVIDFLQSNGEQIEPDNGKLINLFREFSEAVINPGGARWRVFFMRVPPDVMASMILNGEF